MGVLIDLNDENTFSIVEHFAESLPGGFFIYHADGNEEFIYVNRMMLRIFGCNTIEEFKKLTKNSFRTMVHPDDVDEVEKSIAEQIEKSVHDLDYVEYRIIRKDGAVRWIVDYGHFTHSELYGDIFYVFIDDATEKRMLEIKDERSKNVIEGLSNEFDSIYLVNTKANTMMPYAWNDSVSKEIVEQIFHNSITETSFTDFTTQFANKYVSKNDKENFLRAVNLKSLHKKIENKEEEQLVFNSIGQNKENDYVQLSISPVMGTNFLAVMALKTVTEQMEKIKAEALEKLLIEQERDNAIHANSAKSAFLFNMSHDLKTPINAIAGFAELARKNMDGDKTCIADYLEKIKMSSDLLVDLINDVLSMTEIESGNLSLEEAPCDLKKQIMLLGDIFKPQISNKNLSYSITLKIRHDRIIADSLNLKRVLSNVLQNAVNFTSEGGEITFTVSEKPTHLSGWYNYSFSISDTGCGMSPEFMERMYTAFEREQNTTNSHIAGTGLGLTITKNLVDAMHGKIEAESEVGKGTTFKITIPFEAAKVNDISSGKEKSADENWMHRSEHKSKRVLLVEDNELNREIALEIIKGANLKVDYACDGQEAVEIFESKAEKYYDLILMDIQMPRMNGYDATRKIRAMSRKDAKEIPILAITANTMENDKLQAYESGINALIEKPIDVQQLEKILAEL